MNREIKFRVYDKDLKRMRYLNSSHDVICFDEEGNGYYHNMQTGLGEWFSGLMQYTGLKDKNGVEIYEGDIIKYHHKTCFKRKGEMVFDFKNTKCYVVWDEESACFILNNRKDKVTNKTYIDTLYMFESNSMEIIGNIYENEAD